MIVHHMPGFWTRWREALGVYMEGAPTQQDMILRRIDDRKPLHKTNDLWRLFMAILEEMNIKPEHRERIQHGVFTEQSIRQFNLTWRLQ